MSRVLPEMGLTVEQAESVPGGADVMSLMGVLEPFHEGTHDVRLRLSGWNASASTVQRTTERVGIDLARCRAAGETFGPPTHWDWNRDATGNTVAYVGLAATCVRQQGAHAEPIVGRMPWVAAVSPLRPRPALARTRHRLRALDPSDPLPWKHDWTSKTLT